MHDLKRVRLTYMCLFFPLLYLGFKVLYNSFDSHLSSLPPDSWSFGNSQAEQNFFTAKMAKGKLNSSVVVLSALSDLQLLSECDLLVLSDSIFSQVAFMLNYGARGVMPPFTTVSMGGIEPNAAWSVVEVSR